MIAPVLMDGLTIKTSRRIFHRPMISQKCRSRASQTHILGPKKFLLKKSSQDAFVNPSSILWSKTFRVRFSFFQLTALPGRGPVFGQQVSYLFTYIISIYVSICIHEHSYSIYWSQYRCMYTYVDANTLQTGKNLYMPLRICSASER